MPTLDRRCWGAEAMTVATAACGTAILREKARVFCRGILVACALAVGLHATPGIAAEITLQSLRFSDERPVPHLRLEGQLTRGDAERMGTLIERYTRCAGRACNTWDSGPRAVVSLASEGGAYTEGVALAELFRSNIIATVVENGDACLSACAVAFLGGTGFWPTGGVGRYLERLVEPGGELGFHSPYLPAALIAEAVREDRVDEVMAITRLAIADLVENLTVFDVDRWVLDRIVRMGPEEYWRVETVADLHAMRARLPGFPPALLGNGWLDQLNNACAALYALHYGTRLSALEPALEPDDLRREQDDNGQEIWLADSLDRPYMISGCGLPTARADAPLEEVHLYRWDAIEDRHEIILSLLNPVDGGWAQLGYRGGRATDAVLALSTQGTGQAVLNHLLLAPDARLDALSQAVFDYLREARAQDPNAEFASRSRIWPVRLVGQSRSSQVHEGEGLLVVEQIGTAKLFDALVDDAESTQVLYRWDGRNAAVRSGDDPGTGVSYYWIALRSGGQATTIRIEAPVPSAQLSQAQKQAITAIACSVDLKGARLGCYK